MLNTGSSARKQTEEVLQYKAHNQVELFKRFTQTAVAKVAKVLDKIY